MIYELIVFYIFIYFYIYICIYKNALLFFANRVASYTHHFWNALFEKRDYINNTVYIFYLMSKSSHRFGYIHTHINIYTFFAL